MNGKGTITKRPRFVPSQLVSAGDLNAGQDYVVDKLRRHNQTLHGCGTVCGLEVDARLDDDGVERLVVSAGTALDGAGNELIVPSEVSVRLSDLCWLTDDSSGGRTVGTWPPDAQDPCGPSPGDQIYFLAICYRERQECLTPVAHALCAADETCEHLRVGDGPQLMLLDSIHEGEDCVSTGEPVEEVSWRGSYHEWTGEGLAPLPPPGPPVFTRDDPVLDVRWAGSPGNGMAADNVQVEWARRLYFGAGRYRFASVSDGAVIVEIDGRQVLNSWTIEPPPEMSGEIVLAPGVHRVRVAYAHRTGAAHLVLRWQVLESGWHAEYRTFEGDGPPVFDVSAPLLTRIDTGIALDLDDLGSPGPTVPVDSFVVRWQRDVAISSPGRYEFEVETDDGMRVTVDGIPLIDEWQAQARTRYRGLRMLDGGLHRLEVDFWERRGFVRAKLRWRRVGPYNPASCAPTLHPGCVVLAAIEIESGSIRSVENYVFDADGAHQRHVVPTVSAVGTAQSYGGWVDGGPLLAQIVPSHARVGSVESAILVGHRLRGTTEVRFAAGVQAEVLPGASDEWVPLRITVPAGTAPGPRNFTIVTPYCTYDSSDYGLTFDVDPPAPAPSPAPTFSPTFFPTFVPTFFPSFLPTFLPSIAFPSEFIPATRVPTLSPSIFLPSEFLPTTSLPSLVFPSSFLSSISPGGGIGGGIIFGDVALSELDLDPDLVDTLTGAGFEVGGEVLNTAPVNLASRTGMTEVAAMATIERLREVLISSGRMLDDVASRPIGEVDGIGPARAAALGSSGVTTVGELAASPAAGIAEVLGMSEGRAEAFVSRAATLIETENERRSTGVEELPGVGTVRSNRLRTAGLGTITHVALARPELIAAAGDLTDDDAREMIAAAREMLGVRR